MKISLTLRIERSPKPKPEALLAPEVSDKGTGHIESVADSLPAGFMGTAPQDPWDKK